MVDLCRRLLEEAKAAKRSYEKNKETFGMGGSGLRRRYKTCRDAAAEIESLRAHNAELVEVLCVLEGFVTGFMETLDPKWEEKPLPGSIRKARAAIKKAEGEG